MTYPGNPSLGDEVRNRILTTFSQSLDLAEKGRHQEAILGCEFILELDPRFTPAKTLKERLAGGPDGVRLDDLRAVTREGEGSVASASDDLFDLEDLDISEPSAGHASEKPAAPAPEAPSAGGPGATLAAELEKLMAARDYQAVLERAGEHRDLVMADPDLRQTVETAQSRLEAEPYVESFIKEAGTALRQSDVARADVALDKARSLDPSHPLIAELEAARPSEEDAPAAGGEAAVTIDEERREAVFELGEEDAGLDLSLSLDDEDDEKKPAEAVRLDEDEDPFEGFELPDLSEEKPAESPAGQTTSGGEPSPVPGAPAGAESGSEPRPDPGPARPPEPAPEGETGSGDGWPDLDLRDEAGEGDDRIVQLLDEGQEAVDRRDYQAAIDAWSRIFLIDVDHEEAARRIEEARRLKAEKEREVEEILHDGVTALEGGDQEAAREKFERVLSVQPNHLAAREYLQQIESGAPVTGHRVSPDDTAADAGSLGNFDLSDLSAEEEGSEEPLKQEILVPPEPPAPGEAATAQTGDGDAAGAAPTPRRVAAGADSGRRWFVLIGGAVLVLVLVAGWFVFQNKDQFFPNSTAEDEEAAAAPEGPSVIDRARQLHEGGKTAMAIGQLKRIRPENPAYEQAQELIAEWEAPTEAEAAEGASPAVPAADLARRDELVDQAGRAFERGEYLRALELYDDAREIAPLGEQARERFRLAAEALEPFSRQIELFRQGEYEMVMPDLWRLLEEDPSNRVVRRLLVDSYHNRGVRELQRGDAARASAEFQEALALAPDDRELRRHYLFAQTYQQRSKDLLYRIYVKYLPFR